MSSSSNMFERVIEGIGHISITSLETISHLTIGQLLLKGFDRCLGIIENTAQWSLPYHGISPEENGKSFKEIKLVRPLPWIFFLPSLLILRGFRLVWNIGAYILSYPEIQPSDIVKCVQKGRQRLRAIRLNAGKRTRKPRPAIRDKSLKINDAKRSLMKSIQLTLSSLACFGGSTVKSSPSPTRICVCTDNISVTPDEKSATESTIASQRFDSKRKYTNISSDDKSSDEAESDQEPFYTKLERYATLSSSEDEDFNPAEYSSSSFSEDEDPNVNTDELIAELRELQDTTNERFIKKFGGKFMRASESEKQKILEEIHSLLLNKSPYIQIGNKENGREQSMKQQPEQQQQLEERMFYSPKSTEDGGTDNAFYSPLTSSSSSPEPEDDEQTNGIEGQHVENQRNEPNNGVEEKKSLPRKLLPENGHKEAHLGNHEEDLKVGEEKSDSLNVVLGNSNVIPAGKNKQNHYYKGKRNHANRKKK